MMVVHADVRKYQALPIVEADVHFQTSLYDLIAIHFKRDAFGLCGVDRFQ